MTSTERVGVIKDAETLDTAAAFANAQGELARTRRLELDAATNDLTARKKSIETAVSAIPGQVQTLAGPAVQAAQQAAALAQQRSGVLGSLPNEAALSGKQAGDWRIGNVIVTWDGGNVTARTPALAGQDALDATNQTLNLRSEVPYTGRNATAQPAAFPQGLSVMTDLQIEQGIPSAYPGGHAGSLLNFTPGNPDGAFQFYKKWQSNEMYLRGYSSAQDGGADWRTFSRLAHSGNIGAPFVLSALHPDYALDNTGQTDVTAALQALLDAAGGQHLSVYLPAGRYLISGAVTVPPGVTLYGEWTGLDEPAKGVGGAVGALLRGSILILRGAAQFALDGGSRMFGFVEYYDQQNFGPLPDAGQPDGLSTFTEYPPTHLLIGAYNGAHISDILYLGGSHFAAQRHSRAGGSNPEKSLIHHIYGMCTHSFLTLYRVTDVPRVHDIMLNPNSIGNFCGSQAKLDAFCTKTAKSAVLFRLARVDNLQGHSIFAYAFKTGVEFFTSDYAGDDGIGGGCEFTNFSLDGVAMVADLARKKMNGFCIKFTNGFLTPLVRRWIEGTAAVPAAASPCVVRLRPGAAENVVQFTNVNVFGGPVGQIADSGVRYTDFVSDGGNAGCIAQLSNYRSNSASVMYDPGAWCLLPGDTSTRPAIQANGVVFNDRHLPAVTALTGQVLGDAPGAEGVVVQYLIAPFRGRLRSSGSTSVAGTGPSQGGGIYIHIGDRRLGNLFWGAGATVGDPVMLIDADNHFEEGDVIRLFTANMGGAQNLAWRIQMEPTP